MIDKCIENGIEWINGQSIATCTFSQQKWINKIKKLAESDPSIEIRAENDDGSITCHIPVRYISIHKGKTYTEEQKAAMAERLAKVRENKND